MPALRKLGELNSSGNVRMEIVTKAKKSYQELRFMLVEMDGAKSILASTCLEHLTMFQFRVILSS